ncbi:SPOR domain-containing protein [Virgibacillus sp. NKC19-3]|uniref:SPOR domain-containing protein n=1 Tax=Virgibacillus saliphilus TaxID=2831674 RepID=UPI001C9B897D|nr:SPOR domain-containing protein [Virgibacillus sp. NKC19-3]MBY7143251.1 SPOR domain-containing protein [Virgibacillus sp. NKC19-3]
MDKKKLIIWKVGKSKKDNREHAATLQGTGDDSVPVFARETDHKPSSKRNKWKSFKPIIVTTISAIAIGSILGVFMLRMFVGVDSDLTANNNAPAATIDAEDEDSNAERMTASMEQMNAYVLQGGVFSDETNAEAWVSNYEQAGFPGFIWEREGQFFLLLGLANTEEHAEQLASQLKEQEFDIYVKEWSTEEGEVDLTEEEHEWLQSFQENWQDELNALENDEGLKVDNWEALMENYPDDSEDLTDLQETLSGLRESTQAQTEELEAQHILLQLWKQYSEIIK